MAVGTDAAAHAWEAGGAGQPTAESPAGKKVFDLGQLQWKLSGFAPYLWKIKGLPNLDRADDAEVRTIDAPVPGSVQLALLRARIIPDWNIALNARAAEWVENRDWVYQTDIPDEWIQKGNHLWLRCAGLDYAGNILLNGRTVLPFKGSFIPYEVDLKPYLKPTGNVLQIWFQTPPRWLGEFGYTSQMTEWKVRFNYYWDWTSRLVQTGIWDKITLEAVDAGEILDVKSAASVDIESKQGKLRLNTRATGGSSVYVALRDGDRIIREETVSVKKASEISWDHLPIELWWPNGMGAQPLYTVEIRLLDQQQQVLDARDTRVGFRHVEWKHTQGAPDHAWPYLCVVNGKPVFLFGVNWTPIRPNFADLVEEDYRKRVTLYRDLGMTMLRVWGGAFLEKQWFYDFCDEMGLLVWQEFPLSSSGLDNYPPDDPASISSSLALMLIDNLRRFPEIGTMKSSPRFAFRMSSSLALLLATAAVSAQPCRVSKSAGGAQITVGTNTIELQLLAPDILRVDAEPANKATPRTLVIDPALKPQTGFSPAITTTRDSVNIRTSSLDAAFSCAPRPSLVVRDAAGDRLLEQHDILGQAAERRAEFLHDAGQNLYGISGLGRKDNGEGLIRNNGGQVSAGQQGEAGAPWFFTTRFGVLIDSDGGTFDTHDGWIQFSGGSRQDLEYFVVAGPPMEVMSGLARVSGRPPLPPRWTFGFLNSQWGSNEAELKQIAATYRAKHIPLDAFILDFDWKAWGEDDYGEWRWNSTSGPGNFSPDKFPDGASGAFAKELGAEGIKVAGILKPRILLYKKGSTTEMHQAAAYAEAHHLWYPGEPSEIDYFTQRPARDLDFSKAETRSWFWDHLVPAFDAGMIGWWPDEADVTAGEHGRDFLFGNFQFLNMGRALYDGQRSHSNLRVWSLNRNNYLGSERYGYAEWSGDIKTGFESMQYQRMRMLATLDVGQPHWSMDTGGFFGHPTDENYARWVEFAAFVPIDRVHGDVTERRQPWRYGPVAEAAATRAIRLRYELLPYIYSYERVASETGIGIVRPLFWAFPDDAYFANENSAWMFGDALLVSPVVAAGESVHAVHLPAGVWYDYFRGTRLSGGKTLDYPVDPKTWLDIPLFVRDGSILATEAAQDFTSQHPDAEITLDIFPNSNPASFIYYDDDGATYAYERGSYYRQQIHAERSGRGVTITFDAPQGTFKGGAQTFLLRVHGVAAGAVRVNKTPLARVTDTAPARTTDSTPAAGNQWSPGQDRFGPVTTLRVPAGKASTVVLEVVAPVS